MVEKSKSKGLGVGFVALIIIVGLIVAVFGTIKIIKSPPERVWSKTDASVRATGMQENSTTGFFGGHYEFQPVVQFQYSVDGAAYISAQVPLTLKPLNDPQLADAIRNEYKHGREIEVFYNPYDPSDAVFVVEKNKDLLKYYGMFLVGGIILAFGIHELILIVPSFSKDPA